MGQFALVLSGTGNHGCERAVKDGEQVLGCQRPDCVDCIAREFARRLKRNGVQQLEAKLIHWPDPVDGHTCSEDSSLAVLTTHTLVKPGGSSVIDNLVTGTRRGSF